MTGSTWGDVALIAFVAAIVVWWLVRLVFQLRRARRVVDMTLRQVEERIAQEQEAERAAEAAAVADTAAAARGPWDRGSGRR